MSTIAIGDMLVMQRQGKAFMSNTRVVAQRFSGLLKAKEVAEAFCMIGDKGA